MSMRSLIIFAILGLVVVGVNATAYRVQETEKAILLNFGNLVDADIQPGLHFKMPIAEEVKKFDGALLDKEEVRSVLGGYLVQETSFSKPNQEEFKVVTKRKPSKRDFNNLVFLWKIVKHVKSNAIVVGKNFCVTGIGTGQTNRVGSVKLALNNSKAVEKRFLKDKKTLTNCMASDAFFPFPDSIELASRNGITCIIQPGGSINDENVVEAADRLNMSMIFTKRRLFSH